MSSSKSSSLDLPKIITEPHSSKLMEEMSGSYKKSHNAMSRQVVDWLPRFEGNDSEKPMEWVEDFENIADMAGTPRDDLLWYLRFYLTGRARMWHRTIANEVTSWKHFRTLFDARYKSEETMDAWERELESKKQDGDVNDLALWMEGMFQRIDIVNDRRRIKYFVRTMDPDLAFQLKEVYQPDTWSQAVQAAKDSQVNLMEFGKAGGLKNKPQVPFVNHYQPRRGTAEDIDEAAAAIHEPTEQMKLLSVHLVNTNRLYVNRPNNHRYSHQENQVVTDPNTVPLGDRIVRPNRPYLLMSERRCYACKQLGQIARDCPQMNAGMNTASPTSDPRPQAANHLVSTAVVELQASGPRLSVTGAMVRALLKRHSLQLTRAALVIFSLGRLPGVYAQEAAMTGTAVARALGDYMQQQLGSNALVLGFGVLAGSSDTVSPVRGFGTGPLNGVARLLGAVEQVWTSEAEIGSRRWTYLSLKNTFTWTEKIKKGKWLVLIPTSCNFFIWSWAYIGAGAPQGLAGAGMGLALAEAVWAVMKVWLSTTLAWDEVRCYVQWHHKIGGQFMPRPQPEEREDVAEKRRTYQNRRDFPVQFDDGTILVRPSGLAVNTLVPETLGQTEVLGSLEAAGRPLVEAGITVMVELMLVVWWLIIASMPAVLGASWWPVLAVFSVACVQKQLRGSYTEIWLKTSEKAKLASVAWQAEMYTLMGGVWINELRMMVSCGSLVASIQTTGQVSDSWMVAKEASLEGMDQQDLHDVWLRASAHDSAYCTSLMTYGDVHQGNMGRALLKSLSYVTHRMVAAGQHVLTCGTASQVYRASAVKPDAPARFILTVLGLMHTCHDGTGGHGQAVEDWLLNNWWVLATTASHPAMPAQESEELWEVLQGNRFAAIARKLLCAVYSPEQALPLGPLVCMHLNWLFTSSESLLASGPHAAMWAAWLDGLDWHVSASGSNCVITSPGFSAWADCQDIALAESLLTSRFGGVFTVPRTDRQLYTKLVVARARCGLSSELVGTRRRHEYAWMTIDELAVGSAVRTAEESRAFRLQKRAQHMAPQS